MAKIVLLHHPYDAFRGRHKQFRRRESMFMMKSILDILSERGHRVRIHAKPARRPKADLLILHADMSRVPAAFLDAAEAYPASINGRVADISKRSISQSLLTQGSDWSGPVIVKSDLNAGGVPEVLINRIARRRWRAPPFPDVRAMRDYLVYDRLSDVPLLHWNDPAVVVEKFVPEVLPDGFGMRTWLFCGPSERCILHASKEPIIKGKNIFRSVPVDVPTEIREVRKELGFDFGKFDFVLHDDGPVLLDANKTPASMRVTPDMAARIAAGNKSFADGIESFL